MVEPIDYDQRQFDVYEKGRQLPPEAVVAWMECFVGHVREQRPLSVLDLGSGTGRFAPALAETFGGPVHGVEPAARMRAIAERSARHPRVTYREGAAELIPLPDASCDLVLMYLSFHHVGDREATAREIVRVLRPAPGGQVLIRSTFADRIPDLLWHRYFPRARAVEEEMFPTVDEVVKVFAAVGLHPLALDHVRHRLARSLADYAAQLRLRAVSTFEHLTDDEIADGLAALDRDAATETHPRPVEADCDVLVLGDHPTTDRPSPRPTGDTGTHPPARGPHDRSVDRLGAERGSIDRCETKDAPICAGPCDLWGRTFCAALGAVLPAGRRG